MGAVCSSARAVRSRPQAERPQASSHTSGAADEDDFVTAEKFGLSGHDIGTVRCADARTVAASQTDDDLDAYADALPWEERSMAFLNPVHPSYVPLEECNRAVAARKPLMNTYSRPSPASFMVRGPLYLQQGGKNQKHLKQEAVAPPYAIEGLSMFHSPHKLSHIAQEVKQLQRFFASHPPDSNPNLPTFFVLNWILSSLGAKDVSVVNHVFKLVNAKEAEQDVALCNAMKRFLAGTDAEKNSQFKFMFRVVDAPGGLSRIVSFLGGERPVLVGKQLAAWTHRGPNYLEIDLDVSSSKIAATLKSSIMAQIGTVVHDHCFLLEAQRQEELPERVLALLRWNWNEAKDVTVMLDDDGEKI